MISTNLEMTTRRPKSGIKGSEPVNAPSFDDTCLQNTREANKIGCFEWLAMILL